MSFPDSFSIFNRFDADDAFDLKSSLDNILSAVNNNANDLSDLKTSSSDIKECVNKLCNDDVLESVNDLGWRLMV